MFLRKIQEIQLATPAPVDQAIDLVQLTSQTCQLFLQQTADAQRRLLQVLIKKGRLAGRGVADDAVRTVSDSEAF